MSAKSKKVRKGLGHHIVVLFAILWALATLYPFVITVFSSLKLNAEIFGSMLRPPKAPVWANYSKALFGARILRCVLNSLILSFSSTLGIIVCSVLISYVLARTGYRLNKALFTVFLTGIVLPIYATLIPLAKTVASSKVLSHNSFGTLSLLYIAINLPTAIFIMTGYLKGISTELDEAAIIDGCSTPRVLLSILLPVSAPAVSTVAILSFLNCYNEMIFGLIFLSDKSKYTVSLGMLYFAGEKMVDMGPQFAAVVIATLPVVAIYMVFQNQIQSGMVAGAVKG